MRDFLRELWRGLVPYLFVAVIPFLVIILGVGMAALGLWLPWDLMAQAGGIVIVMGIIWVGMMIASTFFSD